MTTAVATAPDPLVGLDRPELGERLSALVTRSFQIDQIYDAIYLRGITDFADMTNLSLALRQELSDRFSLGLPAVASQQESADGTTKFLLRLHDGASIETVDIPATSRRTLCISSQAGCGLACAFCVTGYWGAGRNLSAGEIVGSAAISNPENPAAPASHAWVRSASGDVVTYFRINGKPSRARGINDLGVIVGSVDDAPGSTKGFVTTMVPRSGGYVDITIPEGALIQVANQPRTYASGINNAGYISGFAGYDDLDNPTFPQTFPIGFVAVPPAAAQVTSLAATIVSFGLPPGISGSYTTKLESAQAAIASGDIGAACGSLKALANHAQAQSGKKLSPAQAQQVIDQAGDIRRSLGC